MKLVLIDPSQVQHHPVSWQKAYRYAKAMDNGAKFPPVKAHKRDGRWIVQDGAHRTMAAKLTGQRLLVRTKSIFTETEGQLVREI